MKNVIADSAVISPHAVMGEGNEIGPFAVIGPRVQLGDGNRILSHVVIGGPPEDIDFLQESGAHSDLGVQIGSGNIINSFSIVQSGTKSRTRLGDSCFLMASVSVGHDCWIGSAVTIGVGCRIGGHVRLDDHATLGLGVSIHQKTFVGSYSIVGMNAAVRRDVPPFSVVNGGRAAPMGLNEKGISRNGLTGEWTRDWDQILDRGELPTEADERVIEALKRWQGRGERQ